MVSDKKCEQGKELPGHSGSEAGESSEEFYDPEILDKMTTNRGEVKLRTVSFSEDKYFQVTNQKVQNILFKVSTYLW